MLTAEEIEVIGDDFKKTFISFYHFALNIIGELTEENDNLKFAVVNMQVALELFLKYYFINRGMFDEIATYSGNDIKYKDFPGVVNLYYTIERNSIVNKKELRILGDVRNGIVHRGKVGKWDEELVEYIIQAVFFIQKTYKEEFGEGLFPYENNSLHEKLFKNSYWRIGAQNFAAKLSEHYDSELLNCPFCGSHSLINREVFEFDEYGALEDWQCLTCFDTLDLTNQAKIIKCWICEKEAFAIDILNEQEKQVYCGSCLSCETRLNVRKCMNCEKFYFVYGNEDEVELNGVYFCSQSCSNMA